MSLQTPILFCIFNRPDLTARVFREIAQQRPQQLLIACDGPRSTHPGDQRLVEQARAICEQIDWPCEVSRFYHAENRGCRKQMAEAITWGFQRCERLIILEDDCLPEPTFFTFCESLLERFAEDRRVMSISGNTFQEAPRTNASYYFSKYAHIWGWASWRRAWEHYDLEMTCWPDLRPTGLVNQYSCDEHEQRYWTDIFDRQNAGEIDTWDYSWAYACWKNAGLTVLPEQNLVSNIGFRTDATHTTDKDHHLGERPTAAITSLKHPEIIADHKAADAFTWQNIFCPPAWREDFYSGKRRGFKAIYQRQVS